MTISYKNEFIKFLFSNLSNIQIKQFIENKKIIKHD